MNATPRPALPAFRAWRPLLWAGATLILLYPLVAMQFTTEVVWDRADFLAAALLLGGLLAVIELAVRFVDRNGFRFAAIAGAVLAVLTIWADAAVGVF